jgi:PIN domain nuclease of toxin-antitoxin system
VTDEAAGAVLDASALLAYLQDEAGSEMVEAALATGAIINAVNYAEVLSRLVDAGQEPATAHRRLRDQGLIGDLLHILPLDETDSLTIARLRSLTRAHGLSLGDRACLATGLRLERPVISADRDWAVLDVGVTVRLIRP